MGDHHDPVRAFAEDYLGRDGSNSEEGSLRDWLARHPKARERLLDALVDLDSKFDAQVDEPLQDDDPDAQTIGPYRVVRELGRGGQAVVYLARDTRLPRNVALKVVHGSLPSSDGLRRFELEAQVTSRLDHASICPVYETGHDQGSYYIAMRFVEGRTLAEWIRDAVLLRDATNAYQLRLPGPAELRDVPRTLAFLEQLARALHVAHEAGVIHRDVKPSNVLVTDDGVPVILDFGLARDNDSEMPGLTETGDVMGTPAYMSPEQVRGGDPRPDRRTDVYSLGVTLYEALTGANPFHAGKSTEIGRRIQDGAVRDPRRLRGGLSRDVCTVLRTAMDVDRDRRYASALEFAEDLGRIRQVKPIQAVPPSAFLQMRRLVQRRPAQASAITATLIAIVILLFSLPAWDEIRAGSRRQEWIEAVAKIHPLNALESFPHERALVPKAESRVWLEQLRLALSHHPEDVVSRMALASVHLDRGEHDQAVQEFERIVDADSGEYLLACADRYRRMDRKKTGHAALDLEGLPDPATVLEACVAGYHALRGRQRGFKQRAEALLRVGGSREDVRALWLHIRGICLGLRAPEIPALIQQVTEFEQQLGTPTALTQFCLANLHQKQKDYPKVITAQLRSLELAPEHHGAMQNLGTAYKTQLDFESAAEWLDRAKALRPWIHNTTISQVQLARRISDYDGADALLDTIPEGDSRVPMWRVASERAWLMRLRAVLATKTRGLSAARDALLSAIDAQQRVIALLGEKPRGRKKESAKAHRAGIAHLKAHLSGDAAAIGKAVLHILAEDPLEVTALVDAAKHLPSIGGKDGDGKDPLAEFFKLLAERIAPNHAAVRALRQE